MRHIRKEKGFLKRLQKKQGAIIVGVWGVHSGAGVTTFSVALANYMQGFLNRKTVLYECNSKNDFAKIYESVYGEIRENSTVSPMGDFVFKQVKYVLKGNADMPSLVNAKEDVVIVDFGCSHSVFDEFVRCNHKIVISSMEAWYCRRYEEFCKSLPEHNGSDTWLYVLGACEKELRRIGRTYNITTVKRPYIENAYIIDKDLIQYFSYLFN